ncbi:MAG TPA: hypothetical protein VHM30_11080, partial [Gemmatimonadaceae bacterium]|nr:hypothetical protein [Gemmatimonadaceae bacterium]
TTQLSPHLALVERVHVHRTAYVGMVESTGSFFLPIPYAQEEVVGKRVMRGARTVWTSHGVVEDRRLAPSPDEQRLLLWERVALPDYRWRILDTSGGPVVTVAELTPLGHVEERGVHASPGYLVRFLGWSPDSRSIEAETELVEIAPNPDGGLGIQTFIRELWTIDASTGAAKRTERCTRPNDEWTDGPCADRPRAR